MSYFSHVAKVLLPVLFIVGILGTHWLAFDNGMFDQGTLAAKSKRLPESRIPLKTHWTGIDPLDQLLTGMVCFFWGVVDNKHPTITLQSIHFLGQLSSIWCLLVVESFRVGNSWRVIAFITLWGLGLEFVAMAVAVPLYCFVHLLTSPTAADPSTQPVATRKTNLLIHPVNLALLPWTLAIGHFVPAGMLQLLDNNTVQPLWKSKQLWILLRLIHPVITATLHLLLSIVISNAGKAYASATQRNREVLRSLNIVYSFATYVAVLPHVGAVTLVALSQIAPGLFASKYHTLFNPYTVWWPKKYFWQPQKKVTSVAQGMAIFLQYDEIVSLAATLIWAIAVNRQALSKEKNASSWLGLVLRVVFMTIVGGPAAAAIALIQERDQVVLDSPEVKEDKKGN